MTKFIIFYFIVIFCVYFDGIFGYKISFYHLAKIEENLRTGKLSVNEAMSQTRGNWLKFNDTFFEAAVKELGIQVHNDSDQILKKEKFVKNLAHAENLTKINKHASFGVNKFSFMDFEEYKKTYLMKPRLTKHISTRNAVRIDGPIREKRSNNAPSLDLRKKGAITAIKDQGECGCCWAFATASTMETANYRRTGKLMDLSEQQFINCDREDDGCEGGWFTSAFDYAGAHGIPQESTNPYRGQQRRCSRPMGTLVKVNNFTQIQERDTTSIINALNQGFSVAAALQAGTHAFMSYRSGILNDADECEPDYIDHAIVIVGYGTENDIDYWIVRNSWGKSWGEAGYVRIQRGINYCNLENYPFFPTTSLMKSQNYYHKDNNYYTSFEEFLKDYFESHKFF